MASSEVQARGRGQDVAYGRRSRWLEVATALAVAHLTAGCESGVLVGAWSCGGETSASSDAMDAGTSDAGSAVLMPWSSGFEDGFCGYPAVGGFCYFRSGASYQMVMLPVHSGHFAAAFTVDSSERDPQARCVRHGVLPTAAYYGAWYFIPSLQTNTANWNLFHFQGGRSPSDRLHGLWDVSLVNDASGQLNLSLFAFLGNVDAGTNAAPPVPIDAWFHVQIYLRRAADATGEVTVYQDGVVAYHLTGIVTDDSDYGQWYVGNLATGLMPKESTLYVDDVEISDTR